jgi:hypothetical protein
MTARMQALAARSIKELTQKRILKNRMADYQADSLAIDRAYRNKKRCNRG